MKREVMEAAGLEAYAVAGLIIFVIVFILILLRLYSMKSKEADVISEIPLKDDTLAPSITASSKVEMHEPQGGL